MTYTDIKKKSDAELRELIVEQKKELQAELFKGKLSRKASIIKKNKLTIARALTELSSRRHTFKVI